MHWPNNDCKQEKVNLSPVFHPILAKELQEIRGGKVNQSALQSDEMVQVRSSKIKKGWSG